MKPEFRIRLRDLDLDSHSKSGIVKWEDQVTKVRPGYRKRSQSIWYQENTTPPPSSYLSPSISTSLPGGSDDKESTCNAGDAGLISGLGRSPGEGYGYPLQYSCLENPIDRGTWWATIHGVAESDMTKWLYIFPFPSPFRPHGPFLQLLSVNSFVILSALVLPSQPPGKRLALDQTTYPHLCWSPQVA